MIRIFFIIFLSLLIPGSLVSVFGVVNDFSTNKSLYYDGDQLIISGDVSYDSSIPFVTIQIFTPGKSNFADFNTVPANSDGSFSTVFNVGGPTWSSYGIYPIKVTYDGHKETTIEYHELEVQTPEPSAPETPSTPEPSAPETPSTPEPSAPETISESPSLESISTFSTLKLQVPNFPAFDKSPQYYIDRYNNESNYKSWFDSQFPNSSIYNVLGYADPVSVPDWIRNNAEWWAIGEIDDSTFVSGIEFMLENNIIMVSSVSSGDFSDEEIPGWVRNNAHWWSQDLISEDEFVSSLEYLIGEGIITIN